MSQRLKRRLLLSLLARQTPEKLLNTARKRLPAVFASAAERSPAYRTLLAEAGIDAQSRDGLRAPDAMPVLDKQSTFQRFPLDELLAADVAMEKLGTVLTSSGYGASAMGFGISDRKQQAATPDAIDLGLQNAFGVDDRNTLIINTLPMGVVFESHAACVSNVSVREDMALAILRHAGPRFEQVILAVDPLFCKRFLDNAETQGVDLSDQRIHLIIGEETFQEPFRDYLRAQLALPGEEQPDQPFLGSSMGVGELGLNIFFETPETVALRRALQQRNPWARQPVFFCFNPLRSWVEVHEPDARGTGDLLITMMDRRTTVPLPRYRTGDRVAWVSDELLASVPDALQAAIRKLPFPMVSLHGRDRDQLGDSLHVDDLKALQYRDMRTARQLSGAFRAELRDDRLYWHLQRAQDGVEEVGTIEASLRALFQKRAAALGEAPGSLAELRVFPYGEFPYGMTLDYERKFRYAGVVQQ